MENPFLDPRQFKNEEELLRHVIENVIKPRLQEELGEMPEDAELRGIAYFFGLRAEDQGLLSGEIERMHQHLTKGLSLDYILREMTSLRLGRTLEKNVQGLTVRYIELLKQDGDPATPSAEDLAAQFALEPPAVG